MFTVDKLNILINVERLNFVDSNNIMSRIDSILSLFWIFRWYDKIQNQYLMIDGGYERLNFQNNYN